MVLFYSAIFFYFKKVIVATDLLTSQNNGSDMTFHLGFSIAAQSHVYEIGSLYIYSVNKQFPCTYLL